ncbi:hypothetical protein ACFX2I_003164 [Malus domestica]
MPVSSMLVTLFRYQSSNFIPSPLVELPSFIKQIDMLMQIWSNERYGSVEHRVMVNSKKKRFSIAYFLNPAHYTQIKPLEELLTAWESLLLKESSLTSRYSNTENIQIYHFRAPD